MLEMPTHTANHIEDDRALVEACGRGDADAFDRLLERSSRLVTATIYRTFNRYGASPAPEDVEDLHNGLFVSLMENGFRRLKQFEGRSSLGSYICVIASRQVVDVLRRRKPDTPLDEVPSGILPAAAPAFDREMEEADEVRALRELIENMPVSDRLALKLLYERGLTPKNAAKVMGLTPTAFYKKKSRALAKIRRSLGETFPRRVL